MYKITHKSGTTAQINGIIIPSTGLLSLAIPTSLVELINSGVLIAADAAEIEEGTWNPEFRGHPTPGILEAQANDIDVWAKGYYQRIGKWCNISASVYFTSKGTISAGQFLIMGLPFGVWNDGSDYVDYPIALNSNVSLTGGWSGLGGWVSGSSALPYVTVGRIPAAGGYSVGITWAEIPTDFYVDLSGRYLIDVLNPFGPPDP